MNLFEISLLLIILPLISQLIIGSMAIFKRIKWNFDLICLINLFSQFVFIIVALKLVEIDAKKQSINCGMPQMSMLFFGIAMIFILIFVMILQLIIRRIIKRKQEN